MAVRCHQCMALIDVTTKICPRCSKSLEAYPTAVHYLPQGTILHQDYEVVWVLGSGGFGITYLCFDKNLERKVAIKEYFPRNCVARDNRLGTNVTFLVSNDLARSDFDKGKESFVNEAITLDKLDVREVPAIANVHGAFEENDTAYFVMEYVEGVTLERRLSEGGRMRLDDLLRDLEPLFDTLSALHAEGIIHRDISPANIIIRADGAVRLVDFGCARRFVGSDKNMTCFYKPGYTPIEQFRGHPQDPRTDVYALSATILECITGVRPPSVSDRVMGAKLARPRDCGVRIDGRQEEALLAGLGIRPDDRIASIGMLWDELSGTGDVADAPPDSRMPPASSWKNTLWQQVTNRRFPRLEYDPRVGAVGIGGEHIVAVTAEGRVRATGANDLMQCDVSEWRNIVRVSCGYRSTVGLKADGTCVATGSGVMGDGEIFRWSNMAGIACGAHHVLGMRADRTAVAFGRAGEGQCSVTEWRDIVAVAAGNNHSVGLTSDGRVVCAGSNASGQCDVEGWRDVTAIAAAGDHTIALTSAGEILATGDAGVFRFEKWEGIKSIATGLFHVVGITDGSWVLNTGHESDGIDGVHRWWNVKAIYAGYGFVVGVRGDGTVLSTRSRYERCTAFTDTSSWRLFEGRASDGTTSKFDEVRNRLASLFEAQVPLVRKCMTFMNQHNPDVPMPLYEAADSLDPLAVVASMAESDFHETMPELVELNKRVWDLCCSMPEMPPLSPLMRGHCFCFAQFLGTFESAGQADGERQPSKRRFVPSARTYEGFVDFAAGLRRAIRELKAIP